MAFSVLAWTAALAGPIAFAQSEESARAQASKIAPRMQPDSHNTTHWPTRPLPWGEINFIHTTDTHGWLEGHLNEVNYGADWGDFVSFVTHMRNQADQHNVDLLVVDTGIPIHACLDSIITLC
jgi:2',3'-cyclic-nucleotide 2'-phosphodiesterase (5'-nucleotidase family)